MRRRGASGIRTQYDTSRGGRYPGAEEDLSTYRKDHPEVFLSLRKPIDERGTVLPAMTR
jgi:hypothetical protein